MAEPIKNRRVEVPAPYVAITPLIYFDQDTNIGFRNSTPQNTPASNAPISSHAQQPGVASIKEGMLIHHHRIYALVFQA